MSCDRTLAGITAALLGAAIGFGLAAPAAARPTIRQSFFNVYSSAVGSKLDNLPSHAGHCGVCHYDLNGGGTRNPYGVRLGSVIGNYSNNDAGRQQAIHAIEVEDSDADGHTTLVEVTNLTFANTPTFPGLTAANVGSCANIPVLAELTPYLTPQSALDTQPPVVQLSAPDGGNSWIGGSAHAITWSATDNVGITAVDVYWRDAASAAWTPVMLGGANSGSLNWFVPNMPTSAARVKVVAWDARGNAGRDSSAAVFTITATPGGIAPTTLRDFELSGTQPLQVGALEPSTTCTSCHGGYAPATEPGHLFKGSMMAQAGRDPLFYACLAVADRDAPGAGDLCIRCHSMSGWMAGRSQPTNGGALGNADRDGVNCDLCHRLVDPVDAGGVSPPEDDGVLLSLLPGHTPVNYSNGQMVLDPQARRRGPYNDTVAPHQVLSSAFHRSSDFCGTCHDVSNPVFVRTGERDYVPGPLDERAPSLLSSDVMPLERTYSEWKHSAYPSGVYAPEFVGTKPGGIASSCQDCHMPDANGKGCNDPLAQTRSDLPRHDLTGGSSWMLGVVGAAYPAETDAVALADGAARSRDLLGKAATLDVEVVPEGDSTRAIVTVTNRTGHKLPTGYPEGRRMWIELTAYDGSGAPVAVSGAYDAATGLLAGDPLLRTYETHLGISPGLATALGAGSGGPSFHFALNDTVYLDNRIPPAGFTNAAFAGFGGGPVDPEHAGPGPRYADGQNWDVANYPLPPSARSVKVRLLYQSTSREYVEFLRDQNSTNTAGQQMYDAWVAGGRAQPVEMERDSAAFGPLAVDAGDGTDGLSLRGNPFSRTLHFELTIGRAESVRWSVFDAQGRHVASSAERTLSAGRHVFGWDGLTTAGADAGAGVFWLQVRHGKASLVRRVVRIH